MNTINQTASSTSEPQTPTPAIVLHKYLNRQGIDELIGEITIPNEFALMSQDSYNETAVGIKILKTGQVQTLLLATLNIAIVGMGNRKYGTFKFKNEIIEIAKVFTDCNVRIRLQANTVLSDDELTVQRLCRFFRHHIRDYLVTTGQTSYLFRKYTPHERQYSPICFRGAEYLEDLEEGQIIYLGNAFSRMDQLLNTDFAGRFGRIRLAQAGKTFEGQKF